MTKDETLRTAIVDTAKRFYTTDKNCNTKGEPAGSDFLSPCLTEAALMGRLLPRDAYLAVAQRRFCRRWTRPDFKPLTEPVDTTGVSRPDQLAGKSHLIGPRVPARRDDDADRRPAARRPTNAGPILRRLAAIHGVKGMQAMYDAGYLGSHWLGTYAVLYMLSGAQPLNTERPHSSEVP